MSDFYQDKFNVVDINLYRTFLNCYRKDTVIKKSNYYGVEPEREMNKLAQRKNKNIRFINKKMKKSQKNNNKFATMQFIAQVKDKLFLIKF